MASDQCPSLRLRKKPCNQNQHKLSALAEQRRPGRNHSGGTTWPETTKLNPALQNDTGHIALANWMQDRYLDVPRHEPN